MTAPYLKVAGFVVLATMDLIMALIFHVFWSSADFMCECHDDGGGHPDITVLALLATVAFLHFARTVSPETNCLLSTDRFGNLPCPKP
eukprot:880962-Rhodomonas_salina.1